MPGSTAASSEEQTKAKVTESSATNGIFVRPVAVAGIFRPPDDKPPALPEKRRFSALSGDLRPCSTGGGVSNDEFARRRQSFDTKTKETPFGQALLRKTPRNSNASLRSSKPDLATNGSHEDVSPNESISQVSLEKSVEKLNSKSELPTSSSNSSAATNDLPKKEKTQTVTNAPKDESKFASQFGAKSKNIANETTLNTGFKNSTNSNVVNSVHKIFASDKSSSKSATSDSLDKISSSTDSVAQPKKVYGLMKRDSKTETTVLKGENSVNVLKSNADQNSTSIEKSFAKKDTQYEISTKAESAAINSLDTPKNKVKVYGLSKTNIKKEVCKDDNEIKVSKFVDSNIANKATENVSSSKVSSISTVRKSFETRVDNKTSENKILNKDDPKVSEKFSINKPLETETKPPESYVVNKSFEIKSADKPPEIISNKISDTQAGKKFSERNALPKTTEVKLTPKSSEIIDASNLSKNTSLPSKEVASKISDSTTASVGGKIIEKVNEFQKAQSPPKDFRTVRRTSDVIAAKIQNIFSNISTPEKPPPLLSKKFKIQDKSECDTGSVKAAENKTTNPAKLDQTSKQSNEKQAADSDKIEAKMPVESKSLTADAKNLVKVTAKVPSEQEVKINIKRPEGDSNKERKYKEQTPSVADHSSLKKENKLASESSDVLQSCKVSEVATTCKVTAEVPLEKADSKIDHSGNAVPSKAQDKKFLNIGGKMPIKKQNLNSADSTASLKATNRDDRKSSDPTIPQKFVMENFNKISVLKTESSNTSTGISEKVSKSVSPANAFNSSLSSSVDLKNNYNINQKVENTFSVKDNSSAKSAGVSQTFVKTSAVQKVITSCASEKELQISEIHKTSNKIVNNCVEVTSTNQVSKIEVAKITPCTAAPVPTVNVLFRTKSPQSTATKEENRKKVVVETYSGASSVPSGVINASNISGNISSSASESVQEALKAVENVQKSLSLPKRHSIVNLKNEELVSVTLSTPDSPVVENSMPPSAAKITEKCSSVEVNDSKTEMISKLEKNEVPSFVSETKHLETSGTDSVKIENSNVSAGSEISNNTEMSKTTEKGLTDVTGTLNDINNQEDFEIDKRFTSSAKFNVVDLGDWSKKFQSHEPEPPRVPVRRRAMRESMPPSLPIRSRFGSLKRLDDSPKYIARSPSQSSLPQRYSYTEMLSKVCSMGVLPYTEPLTPKSYSSSSSQVSELWSELGEEQSTTTHTSEMLETETTERMRLEKEVQELQSRCSQVQLRSDKMEMEMMEARVYRTPELNGDLSEDEDVEANSSLYKQKYERAVRDMEIMKRRIQQQHEEEIEQKAMLKKASDKRLAEALEDVEEERQVANQWKRKAQKLGSELQDLRLMLEEQMARNGELEKKQRRFDAELSAAQEEIKKERLLREKFSREKDQAMHEKYSLEQDLQSSRLDVDTLHEKITQLNRELDELSLSSKGEEEVTQLKRAKQELERKSRDQEEELEELAAQVGMLEQAKLRLEMSLEKVRQEHRREASVREEEIEEIRASFSKKIKNLEAQLESEQDERHQLMKQKHELERRLYEMADQPPPHDPEIERRLRRDLKRTKALLRDAQSMLEHTREGQSGKTLIRQLKNQLEDSEFAKAAAVKARQAVETELHDCQTQLEEATRTKNEAESRCLQLSREKSAIQTQLEEAEEEMAEVMKKYKAVVAQMSIDQKAISEQNQQIADLETEKQMLKDQLSEVSHKFEHLAGQSEDTHKVHRLDGKVRDLESKLELEQTTRSRLEHQIARLKEQNERAREECDSLRNKELQAQEGVRRLQRQMRDLREDYSALQQKEAEAYRKQHELEMALENTETDLQVTKNDLRLACQRIQDLQSALEDDLDSGTDVPDDSGSDSDDSFELSVLRNQSVTPTQRCDSAASNYSLASEGFRSRTSSFTHELSAFSRMMLNRKTSMDFLG